MSERILMLAEHISDELGISAGHARKLLAAGTFGARLRTGRRWAITTMSFRRWSERQEEKIATGRPSTAVPKAKKKFREAVGQS